MTAAHINALNLLGKKVQFVWKEDIHFFECTGVVTDIVISLSSDAHISIDDGEFHCLSDLIEFRII